MKNKLLIFLALFTSLFAFSNIYATNVQFHPLKVKKYLTVTLNQYQVGAVTTCNKSSNETSKVIKDNLCQTNGECEYTIIGQGQTDITVGTPGCKTYCKLKLRVNKKDLTYYSQPECVGGYGASQPQQTSNRKTTIHMW